MPDNFITMYGVQYFWAMPADENQFHFFKKIDKGAVVSKCGMQIDGKERDYPSIFGTTHGQMYQLGSRLRCPKCSEVLIEKEEKNE